MGGSVLDSTEEVGGDLQVIDMDTDTDFEEAFIMAIEEDIMLAAELAIVQDIGLGAGTAAICIATAQPV